MCGATVSEMVTVDAGLRQRLADVGESQVPNQICVRCYGTLGKKISAGAQVFLKEKAKEEQKLAIWKSRVTLIKTGRQYMSQKMYAEAAISYEKYIRVLEIIYELAPGTLHPDRLKQAHQTKELTIVASVYWDLLRIYDTSSKYSSRQKEAARKLAQFLRYTPIYPDIIKKAQAHQRRSKNPGIFKEFLKACEANKSNCFIATAVFESPIAEEVLMLRVYRDFVLQNYWLGRMFIRFYYFASPSIANYIERFPVTKCLLRPFLKRLAIFLNTF